ncbi:DNA-binding CsgD family transcriptional regulator OS=Streptomyces violarus OX=67380 GN=FHS41_000042 PE=4 SV=1 [Streptomyces violarus]
MECVPWLTEGLDRARRAGLLSSPYPLEMRYLRLVVLHVLGRWDECVRAAAADAEPLPAAGAYTVGPALYVALARGAWRPLTGRVPCWRGPSTGWPPWSRASCSPTRRRCAVIPGTRCGARSTVAALTDEAGARPEVAVRLAALALSAVADAATEPRSAGDEATTRRWTDTAAELVELARATATHAEHGTPQGPEGQAWLARAEAEWIRVVSGPDAAAWSRALTAFGFGDVYEQARCRLRYAEALVAAGRREEAAAEAREVRETADRLGATPLREQVDVLVRRGRLADTPDTDERVVLTAREQEVLRLLALGRSNRQIGEELFITGKTASVHVSNILAKLGAASRGEAVAIAYREGLITPERSASG